MRHTQIFYHVNEHDLFFVLQTLYLTAFCSCGFLFYPNPEAHLQFPLLLLLESKTSNFAGFHPFAINIIATCCSLFLQRYILGLSHSSHPTGMYGLPRPWYFPLQKSYWLGSGRIETWEWPWGGSARLSVMEEDQACAMEHRRSGTDSYSQLISFQIIARHLNDNYRTWILFTSLSLTSV